MRRREESDEKAVQVPVTSPEPVPLDGEGPSWKVTLIFAFEVPSIGLELPLSWTRTLGLQGPRKPLGVPPPPVT